MKEENVYSYMLIWTKRKVNSLLVFTFSAQTFFGNNFNQVWHRNFQNFRFFIDEGSRCNATYVEAKLLNAIPSH